MKQILFRAFLTTAVIGVLSTVASAAIISGELNNAGDVQVTATDINFLPLGVGTGTFTVTPGTQTGSFIPLASTTGTILDLNQAAQPTGTPLNLANFMTFASAPGLHFDLDFIDPGVYTAAECGLAPAPGQTCTPFPSSPFNLANTAVGSTASFTIRGIVSDGSGDPSSSFTGTISTSFTGIPYQQLLATVAQGGSVDASFQGNFVVTAVPEPSTLVLSSLGALLVLGAGWRRRRRA